VDGEPRSRGRARGHPGAAAREPAHQRPTHGCGRLGGDRELEGHLELEECPFPGEVGDVADLSDRRLGEGAPVPGARRWPQGEDREVEVRVVAQPFDDGEDPFAALAGLAVGQ